MAFSLLSKRHSKIGGNQITFGAVDFQPHPPTLAPIFANLDQGVDLTIGSFNFRVGSLGSVRLSDPMKSVRRKEKPQSCQLQKYRLAHPAR
jgi:hypothetical protein